MHLLLLHHLHHYLRHHCIMPILMLEIPQNPLPYNRDSFLNCTKMDLHSTVLVELPTDPMVEEGLSSHAVVELCFARFQECNKTSSIKKKCWRVHCPVYNLWRNYWGENEEVELEEVHLGPLFQSHKLDHLSNAELTLADRVVFFIWIRPCKTRIRSVPSINSFIYCHETINLAYEGAGWAFPTKTYWHALLIHIHFQLRNYLSLIPPSSL